MAVGVTVGVVDGVTVGVSVGFTLWLSTLGSVSTLGFIELVRSCRTSEESRGFLCLRLFRARRRRTASSLTAIVVILNIR